MTLSKSITILGVEFGAECEFDCEFRHSREVSECWGSRAVENRCDVEDIRPEPIEPTEDLYKAALRELIQRGMANNSKTRKRARFKARKIEDSLANSSPWRFVDEDELREEALNYL